MGKNKAFILNRKQYDKIRKMDHCQMSMYMQSIHKAGYEEGLKAAEGLTVDEVKTILKNIKGIGEKKAEMIAQAIDEELQKGRSEHE